MSASRYFALVCGLVVLAGCSDIEVKVDAGRTLSWTDYRKTAQTDREIQYEMQGRLVEIRSQMSLDASDEILSDAREMGLLEPRRRTINTVIGTGRDADIPGRAELILRKIPSNLNQVQVIKIYQIEENSPVEFRYRAQFLNRATWSHLEDCQAVNLEYTQVSENQAATRWASQFREGIERLIQSRQLKRLFSDGKNLEVKIDTHSTEIAPRNRRTRLNGNCDLIQIDSPNIEAKLNFEISVEEKD